MRRHHYPYHRSLLADWLLAIAIGAGLTAAVNYWATQDEVICPDYSRVMQGNNGASHPVRPAHSLAHRPVSEAFMEPSTCPEDETERDDDTPTPPHPSKRSKPPAI